MTPEPEIIPQTEQETIKNPFLTDEEQKLVDEGKIQDPEWD